MPRADKAERVQALRERIEGSSALLLAEYRGLTVSEIGELRRSLRETDTSFAVVKNTLMQRAVSDAGMEELRSFLVGPSAVAFITGDPVAAAKRFKTMARQHPSLVLKGGFLDGQVLDAEGANALAELESRDVMLSKIAGMRKSEMTRAAATFVSAQSKFLSLLEAYKAKLPATLEPAAEEAEEAGDVGEVAEAEPMAEAVTGSDAEEGERAADPADEESGEE